MNRSDDKPYLKLINADADPSALGRAMLNLANHAAAVHRFESVLQQYTGGASVSGGATTLDWRGLRLTDDSGHGRPETSPIARLGGAEATEGDR